MNYIREEAILKLPFNKVNGLVEFVREFKTTEYF